MSLYSQGNARKSLVDTVAFRAISVLATMLGYVVLVRGMTEADFGVYSLLYAFIPVVSTVASFGLEQVLLRYQPEYLRAGNKVAAAWLVKVISSSRFVTNIMVLGVILLTWEHIAPVFKLGPYRPQFLAFSFLVILHFQSLILQFTMGAHMLHRYGVGSTAILSIVKLVAYLVIYKLDSLTLEAAILADSVAYAISYLILRIAYRRHCLNDVSGDSYKPDQAERRRFLRYGLFSNFNDAGALLMYSTMDNFFLAAFIGTAAVGVYAFYSRISQMVVNVLPTKMFDNMIQPLFFAVPRDEANKKIPLYFSFLVNMNLLVQWPALAFFTAYHSEIVRIIFGGKFVEESWLLPVFMVISILNTMAEPTTLVAKYDEKAGIILVSKLFLVYNIAAMAILVPKMGVYGAALAAGSAQAMKNAFVWWHVRQRAIWVNARTALPISLMWWGCGTMLCIGVKLLLDVPEVVHLIIGMVILGAVGLKFIRGPAIAHSDRVILASISPAKVMPIMRSLGLVPETSASPTNV